MIYGGFPQVIKAGTKDKKMVTRTIHELLLYKDLISKYEKNDYLFQFKRSFVQREMERKIYFQDNSFITSNTIDTDKSRLLQNLVFNHLNRLYEEIFYYKTKNNLEVNFLIKNQGNFMAIQVCYSLNDYETRNREIRALKKCSEELRLKNATILTYNEQGSEKINGLRIDIRPVWKYLLE